MKKIYFFIFLLILVLLPLSKTHTVTAQQYTSTTQQSITSNKVTTKVGDPKEPRPTINSELTFYCQGDTRWQELPQHDLGGGGCGPTSMAIVFSAFGPTLSPLQVDKSFQSHIPNLRGPGKTGSNMRLAVTGDWLQSQGFSYQTICDGNCTSDRLLKGIKDFTDKGYLVIASSAKYPCPANNCGGGFANHIFVVDKATPETGEVNIRDPLNCTYAVNNSPELTPGGFAKKVDSISSWLYAYAIKKG